MAEAPTLRGSQPARAGLWPVWLAALLLFTGLRLMMEGGGGVLFLLIGGGLLYWGVNRRWLAPSRRDRQEQDAHQARLSAPERLQRIHAYQDGSWFESVKNRQEFLSAPCTWYTPTPSGQIKERDSGIMSLTRKGIRLSGGLRSLEITYGRIVTVTAKRDGLMVERSTGPHVIIAVADPIEFAEAMSAIGEARKSGAL